MNERSLILATPERLRLRVEDYMLLNDGGVFDAYTKTELIDGDIYVMNAQYSRHARAKSRLLVALAVRLAEIGSDLEAISEVAVRVADNSMPEPDIVLTTWRGVGPVPVETVALVIEVAESTLDRDCGRKCELYAEAGVPEYWIVDLVNDILVMNHLPDGSMYRAQADIPLGYGVAAATIEGLRVGTEPLLD